MIGLRADRFPSRSPPHIFLRQTFILFHRRQRGVAVLGRCRHPGQFFARPGLDEGRKPAGVIEHGGAQVDEPIHAVELCEHPAHAMRAEIMMDGVAMQAADDRFALRHLETIGGDSGAQRIGAAGHALAAGAMAGSGRAS